MYKLPTNAQPLKTIEHASFSSIKHVSSKIERHVINVLSHDVICLS
jgi:hypothetical protein